MHCLRFAHELKWKNSKYLTSFVFLKQVVSISWFRTALCVVRLHYFLFVLNWTQNVVWLYCEHFPCWRKKWMFFPLFRMRNFECNFSFEDGKYGLTPVLVCCRLVRKWPSLPKLSMFETWGMRFLKYISITFSCMHTHTHKKSQAVI